MGVLLFYPRVQAKERKEVMDKNTNHWECEGRRKGLNQSNGLLASKLFVSAHEAFIPDPINVTHKFLIHNFKKVCLI